MIPFASDEDARIELDALEQQVIINGCGEL
jgi:hypothetical protein